MSKETILGTPRDILVKSTKFAIRRPGVAPIAGGTVGIGCGIASAVLIGPLGLVSIGVGLVGVSIGIGMNKRSARNI